MKFDLVIFDLDGTLYRFDGCGSDDAVFATKFYQEIERKTIDFIAGALSVPCKTAAKIREDLFERYEGSISIGLEREFRIGMKKYFASTWNIDPEGYVSPDPRLRPLLSAIDCKKALLTLAPQVWAGPVLEKLGIDDLFDDMWFGDESIRKPNPRAYIRATKSAGVSPERTMIVEDEPQYLKPAKDLGMTTVIVGSRRAPFIDYNIQEICQLTAVLRGE